MESCGLERCPRGEGRSRRSPRADKEAEEDLWAGPEAEEEEEEEISASVGTSALSLSEYYYYTFA